MANIGISLIVRTAGSTASDGHHPRGGEMHFFFGDFGGSDDL